MNWTALLMTAVLAIAGGITSPNGCDYTMIGADMKPKVMYTIGYYGLQNRNDDQRCLAACDSAAACKSATIEAFGCFLYNHDVPEVFNGSAAGMAMYTRSDPAGTCAAPDESACFYPIELKRDYAGTVLAEDSSGNRSACQDACDSDASCIGQQYKSPNCRLLQEPLYGKTTDVTVDTYFKPTFIGGCGTTWSFNGRLLKGKGPSSGALAGAVRVEAVRVENCLFACQSHQCACQSFAFQAPRDCYLFGEEVAVTEMDSTWTCAARIV